MRTFIIFLLFAINLYSQAPKTLNYQGYLTDSGGNSVSDGNQNITFRIYNVSTGGVALWTEARTVTTSDGVFSVVLGENTPIDLAFDTQYYLGITVGGSELSPRTKISSVSTAFNGVPPGSVLPYFGTSAPTGWLLCDGSAISRTTYSSLFSIIGVSSGNGDGVTTFNLPDLRGRFLRGVDNGAGNDPDVAGRTASNAGGNIGDNVGSLQGDELKSHTHGYQHYRDGGRNNNYATPDGDDTGNMYDYITSPFGGNETRPKNISVNFIIKY